MSAKSQTEPCGKMAKKKLLHEYELQVANSPTIDKNKGLLLMFCLSLGVFLPLFRSGKLSSFRDLKRVSWQAWQLDDWLYPEVFMTKRKYHGHSLHKSGWGSTHTCPASPSRDLAALNGPWKEICLQRGHILLIVKCKIGQCVYVVTLLSSRFSKAVVTSHSLYIYITKKMKERNIFNNINYPGRSIFSVFLSNFCFYWKRLTFFSLWW